MPLQVKISQPLRDGTFLYLSPFYQLGWTLLGVLIICLWTAVLSALLFAFLWYFDWLRIEADIEIRGIDIPMHGEPAYPTAAYGHGWHKDEENKGEF